MKLGGDPDIISTDFGIRKFGYNGDVDAAEDIWSGGGDFDWTKVAANATTTIASSDAQDDTDVGAGVPGTGAWTVEVEGLVMTTLHGIVGGQIKRETVTLNGAADVALVNPFAFVYRARVKTAGTGQANAGLLSIKHGVDVIARVEIGVNQTEMALMVVPHFTSGGAHIQAGYLHAWGASVVTNTAANAGMSLLVAPPNTTIWAPERRGTISVANPIRDEFHMPPPYAPGTKIKIRCTSVSAISQLIQANFQMEYAL